MGEMINEKKIRLASWILALQDETYLDYLEKILSAFPVENNVVWQETVKPTRDHQSIEDMIQEQNYKGFDREAFDRSIKEMDIQEPIEDLLKSLTP
jgi:hypothetical protein